MPDRFEEAKLRVKEGNDLVALLERYLPLRQSGRNMLALCPFHEEKTPSFTVYPDSQHFKCYGCGKAGDVFTFVMEREGLSFREAMELLADQAGVSLDGVFGRPGGQRADRGVDPYAVLGEVSRWFAAALQSQEGAVARDYLESRGLSAGIEPFGLGVHPRGKGALQRFAREKKLPSQVLQQAGLINSSGGEPFYGRLMFPIEDERGRVVGFGGRRLDEESRAKYINSPESPIFRKRRVLYGLGHAKKAGVRRIVVMEGYTDVIACHLAGFEGAVASLGTAFTKDHGRILLRYATDGVVLLFDGDRAGRAAAEKAYGELARTELSVRTVVLPDGSDPADLVTARPGRSAEDCERGRGEFAGWLDNAEDALSTWFQLKRGRLDLTAESNVLAVIEDCARVLDGLEDEAQRDLLRGRMARHLGLSESSFNQSLARRARRPLREQPAEETVAPAAQPSAPTPLSKADVELLACVLSEPGLAEVAAESVMESEELRPLLDEVVRAVGADQDAAAVLQGLFTRFGQNSSLASLLATASDLAPTIKDPREALSTLLRHRNSYLAGQAAQKTRYQLQEARSAGNRELEEELTRRYLAELRQQQFG